MTPTAAVLFQVRSRKGVRVHSHRTATAPARDKQFAQRGREGAGGEAGGQQRRAGARFDIWRFFFGSSRHMKHLDYRGLVVQYFSCERSTSQLSFTMICHARVAAQVLLLFFRLFLGVPLQGTAADIVKTAMVLVARRLDAWRCNLEDGLDCPRLIMQARIARHFRPESGETI